MKVCLQVLHQLDPPSLNILSLGVAYVEGHLDSKKYFSWAVLSLPIENLDTSTSQSMLLLT